ncbi:hypothetical protein H4R20_002063 [Coemansia guatemalensis]|uniref:Gamma interferon inducible lysosomal thiol reductase n=1 Tax=Coemansia guatemalensis TaxID=2761395 RepID=A0A9W8HW87_9FUNG|nr:hypothetical protein H4R20_002063 [Coemansia guatemalensis]
MDKTGLIKPKGDNDRNDIEASMPPQRTATSSRCKARLLATIVAIVVAAAVLLSLQLCGKLTAWSPFSIGSGDRVADEQSLGIYRPDIVAPSRDDKVQVELFVMSRCPDAVKVETVFSEVIPAVYSIMDVQLNFIAKLDPNSTLEAHCGHGEAECRGNIDELCALRHRGDLPTFWRFLSCLNSHFKDIGKDPDLTLQCASNAGLDTAAFLNCATQQEGRDLLKQSIENTEFAGVARSATVYINGKNRCVEDGGWRECPGGHSPSDFIRDICAAYKGSRPRPSICAQYP